jgi:UDP-GlcNAc:undecaprenyl-phosphate GlcNAc-1-phosphate transferase
MGASEMVALAMLVVATGLAAWSLTAPVARLARAMGAIDRPEPRRVNLAPIPRLGGLAVFGALICGFLLSAPFNRPLFTSLTGGQWPALALAATAVFGVGLIDDLRSLPVTVRLLVETVAALAVSLLFVQLCPGRGWPGACALTLLSTAWLVVISNGSNLIDGLDGLAAGVAIIELTALAALAIFSRQPAELGAVALLAGAWAGFWLRNRYPATIFAGDSGALLAGFAVGALALRISSFCSAWVRLEALLLIMAYPLLEVLVTVVRRAWPVLAAASSDRRGRRLVTAWCRPDRDHIHHRLIDHGLSQRAAVRRCQLRCLILAGLGVLAAGRPVLALPSALAALLLVGHFVHHLGYAALRTSAESPPVAAKSASAEQHPLSLSG